MTKAGINDIFFCQGIASEPTTGSTSNRGLSVDSVFPPISSVPLGLLDVLFSPGGLDHRRRKTSDSVNYPMIRCLRSMSRSLAVHDKKDHRYREITIPGRSQLILWGSQDKLSVSGPIVLLLLNQVWWKWLSGGLPWQAWIITRFSDWVGARGLSVHIWRCRV